MVETAHVLAFSWGCATAVGLFKRGKIGMKLKGAGLKVAGCRPVMALSKEGKHWYGLVVMSSLLSFCVS